MNTWHREHTLWLLHRIIAFHSQLLRWKRGFQLHCFLKRHHPKSSGHAVTMLWPCTHWENGSWAPRSSADKRVTFYLKSVLSWQRWRSAGAKLENAGVTTLTLQKLKPDWLFLPNPHMSLHFSLPSFQPIKYRNWGNEVIPIGEHCFLDCLPSPPSWTHSILGKGSRSHESDEFKWWKFMTRAPGFRFRETSCSQWLLTVISLTMWIPRFNGFHPLKAFPVCFL